MTYQEVASMIASVGLPYAYYQFPNSEGKEPPFICFYYPNSIDLIADDRNYSNIEALTIELYSDEKDFEHEEAIEAILSAYDMPYSKTEAYIDSELMYMVTYNTSVLITHTPVISS